MTQDGLWPQFAEVDDYMAEIERDRADIERGIVRIALVAIPEPALALTRLQVEVAAIVRGRLVRLRRECGEMLGVHEHDDSLYKGALELIKGIRESAIWLGLEPRRGRWLET